ncbi:ABC transporter ATP-binding protein [Candidatus Solirubrobacter pratensis]|uniref:ABC transporter ATP-binding protein n=1 Tax=Candidatus Solirubrobacter pratensis TaxID=1298857 RepID=UPI0004109F78|nr:ABC transporter ATP-binding protein [Candidatus Solirubrobacter pratensis]
MTAAIEADGVGKRYGSLVALDGLTFSAHPGEVLGLLGPNGAGKTTCIRVLTAILPASAGRFAVAGVPGDRPEELRRRVGVLPENAGYPRRQTGEEYLRYHARLYGHSRASACAVARELLAGVGLAGRARWSIGSYSRGMRQRLGIARALVNDPRVVFFDEPTLGLDPAGQRDVLAQLGTLASERGVAVLLSTHLLDEVEQHCSRVLILNRGRLVADDTVAEVARWAAAPRRGRIEVAPDDALAAAVRLACSPAVAQVRQDDARPGALQVELAPWANANEVIAALLDAGVLLRAFELEGARLSDAFLAMTKAA